MYTGTVVMVEIPSRECCFFGAWNGTAMPLYASLEKCHKYFMCGPPLDSKKCLNVKHHKHTVRVHLYGYPNKPVAPR